MLSEERSDSVSFCCPGEDLRSESPNVKLLNLNETKAMRYQTQEMDKGTGEKDRGLENSK